MGNKKHKCAVMDSIELLKLPDHLQDNTLTSTPKKRQMRSSLASLQTSVLLDVQSDAYNSQDKSSKKRKRRSFCRSRSRGAFADFDTLEELEVVQSSIKYPFVLSGLSLTPFHRWFSYMDHETIRPTPSWSSTIIRWWPLHGPSDTSPPDLPCTLPCTRDWPSQWWFQYVIQSFMWFGYMLKAESIFRLSEVSTSLKLPMWCLLFSKFP